MWPRKRFDIGWRDYWAGLGYCLFARRRAEAARQVESLWSEKGEALACLSVRSGFDLLWQVLALPAGSEVLVSALTIPHMIEILHEHQLVPVPIDLDLDTMAPRADLLRKAITPATRAVVVAHLFGSRFAMEPIIEVARDHQLLVVEDCAQVFVGGDFRGHDQADVSMFSFGPIKTATALAGAVFRVRDARLLEQLRAAQAQLPVQTRRLFFQRIVKYMILHFLSGQLAFGTLVRLSRWVGWNYDRFIQKAVRGFPGRRWLQKIRRQPSAPVLAMLARRLRTFNLDRLRQRIDRGERLLQLLQPAVFCPAASAPLRSHWAFPVWAEEPLRLTAALRRAGFDATGSHSLCVVEPSADRPSQDPRAARRLLEHMVALPIYPELPRQEVERMALVVLQTVHATSASRVRTRCAGPVHAPELKPG